MSNSPKICVGVIASAHGLKGEVKIRSYTEFPEDISSYGPLSDERGARSFTIASVRLAGEGMLVARLKGVDGRTEAEALRGIKLYVSRDKLPDAEEGEYYQVDLIGLRAESPEGAALGRVRSVDNYGAGDILTIETSAGGEVLLLFTEESVPEVDIAGGRIVLVLPEEVVVGEKEDN
ncbi:MAG: 16S rRNA processing protein RimM [Alphaproteobacteria bacterium]|nr:16S rRNA processing protein RimM [Alphaproteobacteria bacterium]